VGKEAEKNERKKEKLVVGREYQEDKEVRKMDHGKLSKHKKTSTSALEHLVEKKERQAGLSP
jgi:hypothetical protein